MPLKLSSVTLSSCKNPILLPIRSSIEGENGIIALSEKQHVLLWFGSINRQKEDEEHDHTSECNQESFETTKQAILDLCNVQVPVQVPITPHAKRKRTKQRVTMKKRSVTSSKRVTRNTRSTIKDFPPALALLNSENSETDNGPDTQPAKKRRSVKNVKIAVEEPASALLNGENTETDNGPDTQPAKKRRSLRNVKIADEEPESNDEVFEIAIEKLPEPINDKSPEQMSVESEENTEEETAEPEVEPRKPIEVQHLISLHETLIGKQNASSVKSDRKPSKDIDTVDQHSSPALPVKVNNTKSKENNNHKKLSIEEQIKSCMKKKPIVNLAKLRLAAVTDTPPCSPLVLRIESSDDEEDITVPPVNQVSKFQAEQAPAALQDTPAGTVPMVAKRSLSLQLRLSLNESELENSIHVSPKAVDEQMEVQETDHEDGVQQHIVFDDSLEAAATEEPDVNETQETNQSTSQASSSVCSSTAATVILDEEDQNQYTTENKSTKILEMIPEEEEDPVEESSQVRRSVRISHLRTSHRLSISTGLAAKRKSMGDKLRSKKIAAEARLYEKSMIENNEESDDTQSTSKPRPKIVKPVIKRRKIPTYIGSATSTRTLQKRNLDAVESHGHLSPRQPKTKKTRNTFLNRSTASSRARRTPGKASPAMSRSRAILMAGSPYRFNSQTMCHTPSSTLSNLTVDVHSFFKRNTPQKVNFEEELAAKKQQLEEKEKREKELKKKRDAEKLRKIEEKKRKRSMRLRKAAEQREKREKEEKEKQLQNAEQWEKRVAGAEKVKVLRKKDETERIKKLQKKQAEAEELRRREEEEKIKKILEQEQEKEQRLQELKLQKEQETAQKKEAEQKRLKKKQEQDKLREERRAEKLFKKQEEERIKREEEEKAKQRMTEETLKLRQMKLDQEEAAKKKKLQEKEAKKRAEIAAEMKHMLKEETRKKEEKRLVAMKKEMEEAYVLLQEKFFRKKQEEDAQVEESQRKEEEMRKKEEIRRKEEAEAEAARMEQIKEQEAQQRLEEEARKRQEEIVRKKEKEEKRLAAKKKKMEEAQALLDEKAMKRKQEEIARAEELRRRREEIRKEAEGRREQERIQREEEKRKMEEERRRMKEEAEQEKLKKIKEANNKLRALEEEHRKEKEKIRAWNQQNMQNYSQCHTPGPSTLNSTYTTGNPNSTYTMNGSPQSYEITPQVIKVYAPSTEDNYNIDDLGSGDDTDDDEAPRKPIPKWAKGGYLKSELIRQYYQPPDIRVVFKGALSADEVRLDKIFLQNKSRYFKRTSSAQWTSPIMQAGHISFTEQCRGFEYP